MSYETALLGVIAASKQAGGASLIGWDSAFKRISLTGSWTVDSGNSKLVTLATGASGAAGMIGSKASKTDKRYLEMVWTGANDSQLSVGFINNSAAIPGASNGRIGVNAGEFGIRQDGVALDDEDFIGTFTTWSSGDVMMLAMDPATGKGWVGKNGTWFNSGNPAAGTGNIWLNLDPAGVRYACGHDTTSNDSWTCQAYTTALELTYSVPSGFTAWDA